MDETAAQPQQEPAAEPITIRTLDRIETTVVASGGQGN
jgi:hypothetical protein